MSEAVPVLESIKFRNATLRCVQGAVIGILTTIEIIRDLLNYGIKEIDAEWLSNNSIENFFSQVVHIRQKPSALQFVQSIKALSLSKYMQDPVDSKTYKWSFSNISTCSDFLDVNYFGF